MKLIKLASIALVAGSMVVSTGCVRKINEFGNTNLNPGLVAEPITAALFTNVLASMGGEAWNTTPGLYAQLFSETQYTDASRYANQQVEFGGIYSGVLYDCQNIINYNGKNPEKASAYGDNGNQVAIARILKAWWFSRVTDAWGNVPYSEALKFNGNIKYDDQKDIYYDLVKELKEASAALDAAKAPFTGDILLGGNITRWKKFANSLRLILGMRMVKADPVKGKAEVLDALAASGGVITSNADNVRLAYPGGNFNNPFFAYYNITMRLDFAVSKTIADAMQAVSDKRILAYGSQSNTPGVVKGFPYGLTRTDALLWEAGNTDWARIISNSLRTSTMPMPIITAAQVTLARAEAAQRGWTTENAATLYTTGLQLGWEQWGVYNATDFANFLANPAVNYAGGNEIAKICTQRWVASFPDGKEAWNVYRSTGFPVLTPAPGTTTGIPRRLAMAVTEYNLNPTNTQAAAALYTVNGVPDSQYGRMWWDKP